MAVPGTLRDSIYILEGLLEQQTSLNPTEIMTDTAGASDMVFGLFWLLGYQFSPRLADAGEASFWGLEMQADYGELNDIARHRARTDRIEQHWDDMLRIAGSLKFGTVHASELVRSMLKSERPSSLAQAIIDLGRINKTIYLLNYIDDEDYRRRIVRGRKINSMHSALCPTPLSSGTRYTCRQHWSICSLRAWTLIQKIGLDSRPSSTGISMCSGAFPLPWPILSLVENSGHSTSRERMRRLSATFRSDDCHTPLPKKDGATALSGAGSVDTATTWPSKTSRTKNLIIEYYQKYGCGRRASPRCRTPQF